MWNTFLEAYKDHINYNRTVQLFAFHCMKSKKDLKAQFTHGESECHLQYLFFTHSKQPPEKLFTLTLPQ